MSERKQVRIETILAQIGLDKEERTGTISFPIYQSTVYRHPGLGESTGFDYARTGNPTRRTLEQAAAQLEGGRFGFACASGMAALQTVLAMFQQGDHLIVSLDLYGGTYRLFERVLSRFGITAAYVDTGSMDELIKAKRPDTKGLLIETPTNPMMMVTDIEAVCTWAKSEGIITIVDNTLMTPFLQRPLLLGADVVVHSATKSLGGHNDVLAGLIMTDDENLAEKIGFLHNSIGAVLAPQESWLLMRGMKTLALRMERSEANALVLTEYLDSHPMVESVYYPGLKRHPGHAVHSRQAMGGGSLFSFRLKRPEWVAPVLRAVEVFSFAESLGGVESLITFPSRQTHADIPEAIRRKVGVDDCLLRVSVGIEHRHDLLDDLRQALDYAFGQV
jgi:cystathionine gamma-synthase